MWAQACETAVYVLSRTGKSCYQEISNRNVEWSHDDELGSSTIYVCWAQSAMYISQSSFGRNSTTRVCLVKWLATWMIKTGTTFTCHFSKRIVHSYVYFKPEWDCTSSAVNMGLENAAVEKRQEDDTMSESSVRETPWGGDWRRVFQEHRTTNKHCQAANVDVIGRLHSFVSAHCYCWWWR